MLSFEYKAQEYYPGIITNKALYQQTGFKERDLPQYVTETVMANLLASPSTITPAEQAKVTEYLEKHVPRKSLKGELKKQFLNFEVVNLFDHYSVAVNQNNNEMYLRIPYFDLNYAGVIAKIVDENNTLLKEGVWGIGELFYVPSPDKKGEGQVWMLNFEPYQVPQIDLQNFIENRKFFSIEEWIDLLVSSLGIDPVKNDEQQKLTLLARLLPLIEQGLHLIELSSSTLGKSLNPERFSRYSRVINGSKTTQDVLFYNHKIYLPGLVTRNDIVMIDNAHQIKNDNSGEFSAVLQNYLGSGKFSYAQSELTASTSLIFSLNITLDEHNIPVNYDTSCFKEFPAFMQKIDILENFYGVIQDWHLPQPLQDVPSGSLGFTGDVIVEVLHELRKHSNFSTCVNMNMRLNGTELSSDKKAIAKLATAYFKLLFPHQQLTVAEFNHYCLQPAIEMRQTFRDELYKLDNSAPKVTLAIK